MKEIEVNVREIIEHREKILITDEEFDAIISNKLDPLSNHLTEYKTDSVIRNLYNTEDYDDNFLDYEITDRETGEIIDPFYY